MKVILEPYLHQSIGLNLSSPFKIEAVTLSAVEANYFSIRETEKGYTHHFAYAAVVQIIESEEGVEVGGLFSHKGKFPIVVKVGHLVEYSMA